MSFVEKHNVNKIFYTNIIREYSFSVPINTSFSESIFSSSTSGHFFPYLLSRDTLCAIPCSCR